MTNNTFIDDLMISIDKNMFAADAITETAPQYDYDQPFNAEEYGPEAMHLHMLADVRVFKRDIEICEKARRMYTTFNVAVWDNALPDANIYISKESGECDDLTEFARTYKNNYGGWYPDDKGSYNVILFPDYIQTVNALTAVVLHQMTHIYCMENRIVSGADSGSHSEKFTNVAANHCQCFPHSCNDVETNEVALARRLIAARADGRI